MPPGMGCGRGWNAAGDRVWGGGGGLWRGMQWSKSLET